jgi:hypothetical protein
MKKLFVLFSVLAFFSLILVGCQSAEDLSGPGELNKQPTPTVNWEDPLSLGTLPVEVELIAGQFYKVGMVTVEKYEGGIKVIYNVDAPEGVINEVHVDLASELSIWSSENLKGFHTTKDGSPQFGQFDHKQYGTITVVGPNIVEVVFTEANLKLALGVEDLSADTEFFIAAHSVVCWDGGDPTEAICPDLPETGVVTSYNNPLSPDYYLSLNILFPGSNEPTLFNGWCIDLERPLYLVEGKTVQFMCTYNTEVPSCLVENNSTENLNKANWIINNKHLYSAAAVQAALWYLLENIDGDDYNWMNTFYGETNYLEIVNAADPEFVPGCGDKVLVIVYEYDGDSDPCTGNTFQILVIEVPVDCEETCETAMGFRANYDEGLNKWLPVNDLSSLFPKHVWFRYFSFTW